VTKFVVFELWFSFMYACYSSVQVAAMVELAPAHALCRVLCSGRCRRSPRRPDPAICTWLNHTFAVMRWSVWWLGFNAVLSLLAVLTLDHKQTAINQTKELH
jgi:hypothetical protein